MGTKRWIEICFDLETELFQVVLDKHVSVLEPSHVNNASYDSLKTVTSKEVMPWLKSTPTRDTCDTRDTRTPSVDQV